MITKKIINVIYLEVPVVIMIIVFLDVAVLIIVLLDVAVLVVGPRGPKGPIGATVLLARLVPPPHVHVSDRCEIF
ncbi:MAG: hypothetical protein WC996_04675 [Peptostreptococcales bacterium]